MSIMKKIIAIISTATTVLAFYNEAIRAGLIEPIEIKPLSLTPWKKEDEDDND
jgi:hypothetical protein